MGGEGARRVGGAPRTMVPVPSTSYSWNTAAMNSRSSLLRDCHPPFWPLLMRLAAAARFRLSLCRTLSGLAPSCTMTAMVPALEKIQPSETLCSVSGETLSGTRESTSARVSLDARRSSRSERATCRRPSRVRGRESARRVRNIPTSNSSPAAEYTSRSGAQSAQRMRFPPGNPRAAEPRAQLAPPAPTRLPSDHRSADRDVRPLRFQGASASATRRTRARVFRSSSPGTRREGCPRSVAAALLFQDPHPTTTPAPPPAVVPRHAPAVHLHLHVRQDEGPSAHGSLPHRPPRSLLESRPHRRTPLPLGLRQLPRLRRAHLLDRRQVNRSARKRQ